MRKFLSILGAICLISTTLFGQTITLKGKILDERGQNVSFASVKLKKNDKGVVADENGDFIMQVHKGDILVITGIGFRPAQYTTDGSAGPVRITVERTSSALSEVVITALGQTQSKAKVGYATQTFNTATINKNGATSVLDGLEGKIAGAEISNIGGPGSSTKVVLRGYGVIAGGNNQPLYVIDGVPLSDVTFQPSTASDGTIDGTDGADFGNGMNNINPNDIESVTVLKGTAASSLYGGLAKNGAIMITTKKGKAGKLKVDYNGSFNFSKAGKLPDYQTEFGQGWGGLFVLDENGSWGPRLDGVVRPWGSIVDGDQLTKPFSPLKNPLRQFYVTGHEYSNSIGLSGGTDVTRFYFSYGNVSSSGIIPDNANTQQRNTLSLRTNSDFGRFSINTSVNYVGQNLKVPNTGQSTASGGGVFESLLQIPVDLPIGQFKDLNNKFFNVNNFFTPFAENPYWGLVENGDQQKLDRIFGNVDLNYKFGAGISAELRMGMDVSNARTFEWKNSANAQPGSWVGPNPTNPESFPRTPDFGEVAQGSDYYGIVNGDFIVKYNKDFGKDFSLDALVGANYYTSSQRAERTEVTNIVVPGFYNLSNTSAPPTTTDALTDRRRMGLYGQATLGYKDQLYLTGNIRDDWSSTLPIEHNSIFYPGANLSWVASQLFSSKTTLSYLKFRAAYGRTGSDPDPYLVLPQLGSGTITIQNPDAVLRVPFNGVSGYGINNQIGNPSLKPIFTDEIEVGTEARFLKDRIGLDVSLYDRKTKGQIFAVPIAPSTGYTTLVENLGLVGNKGIEVTLNLKPVETRNFTWNLSYVFARNWNKVLNLTGASQDPLLLGYTSAVDAELRAVVGKTVASIYDGVPQKTATGQTVVNPQTGFSIPNATALDQFGLTKGYYGTALYTYTMGMTNTFTYKDFSLSASLDFRYGGIMYSNTANLSLFVGNSVTTTYNDRRPFIMPNSVVAGPNGTYTPNTTFIGAASGGESDQYANYYAESNSYSANADAQRIIDRSFLKLRDVNLSYNLPGKWASRIKAGSASLGIYGRNFLLWTPKGNVYVDPEASNLGNDLTSELGEMSTAPLTKSYGFILKLVF